LHVVQHTPPTADQMEKVNLHIPLKIALYDKNGQAQALENDGQIINPVLDVKQAEQSFQFTGVKSKPVPALLCDFSAPV
ncbi:aminopeptidase N, partial [Pasteurella multocida subsp. multocida str. Anand1_buffalo]